MNYLKGKNILLAVTAGISAYKSAYLLRLLQQLGADIRVVMSQGAQAFITPLTFQALSGHRVHTQLLDTEAEAGMGHIELARWADAVIIAPATADCLAQMANGQAKDLLTTIILATRAKIAIAPAMNRQMWQHQATQDNLAILRKRGLHIIGPEQGEQACGDVGFGRMSEPENIIQEVQQLFSHQALAGKKLLLTAGPTQEAIDPVRYISNHSSGKMGYAIAQAALEAGAEVIVISGPTNLTLSDKITCINVTSAEQMHQAVFDNIEQCDLFIAAAAVVDYRCIAIATNKIKKQNSEFMLNLIPTVDILAAVAKHQLRPAIVVGFAAETENLITNAHKKLINKQCDYIIANQVGLAGTGFNSDENSVTIVSQTTNLQLEKANKSTIAREIIEYLIKQISIGKK